MQYENVEGTTLRMSRTFCHYPRAFTRHILWGCDTVHKSFIYHPMDSVIWTSGSRLFSIRFSDSGVAGIHDKTRSMSSLSRRACYKCGNVGHYAGQLHSLLTMPGIDADRSQRYVRPRSDYATIVSHCICIILDGYD